MDLLISLYDRLKKLRETGVKMKDIAEIAGVYSSVLSSLYSSVLPHYANLCASGADTDSALDEALKQVNNISKRKLLSCINDIHEKVMRIEPHYTSSNNGYSPFVDNIYKETAKYTKNVSSYAGLYTAYSASSYCDGMKSEPYLICSINEGENMPRVYSKIPTGETSIGAGMFPQNNLGYIFVNETKMVSIALKVLYLQLPTISQPQFIKGIYLCHDYNRSPIARRIVLVREGNEIPVEEFEKNFESKVIFKDNIDESLKQYYDYTCQSEDLIRSFFIMSPDKNVNDLELEKKMLQLL
ncbi:MAG: hypothetical protein R3Y51_00005 [Rikenellaceae bacterium]